MLDMLSVLLATVSARCVRVKVGLGLGLEHEDPGCSRGAERDDQHHPSRCTSGGSANTARHLQCAARAISPRNILWA